VYRSGDADPVEKLLLPGVFNFSNAYVSELLFPAIMDLLILQSVRSYIWNVR
jgi:hypothetical protein